MKRNLEEYNAMFSNPEGVDQVRNARENSFRTSDKEFDQSVKELFGREVPKTEMDGKNFNLTDPLENPYLDMDLDEIKFTPE